MRVLILAVLAFGGLAGPAQALPAPYDDWAAQSGAPAVDYRLAVDEWTCNDRGQPASAFACTAQDGTIYMQDWCLTAADEWCQFYFWHELGHHFDWSMPDWKRRVFLRVIRTAKGWRDPRGAEQSASELFADTFAMCAHDPQDVDYTFSDGGTLGQPHGLNASRLRRVCRLIRQPN
jgi:hypothetical protein